jgi:hypothetical protein
LRAKRERAAVHSAFLLADLVGFCRDRAMTRNTFYCAAIRAIVEVGASLRRDKRWNQEARQPQRSCGLERI